ncbi:DUF302 domain-containing protein [Achromobacter denitrificans]
MNNLPAHAAGASGQARIELPSVHPFSATVARISRALEDAGMTVFARIDHQAAAQEAGLDMRPATVLIYGNPKGGTPLMQAAPTLALDLPLRVLVHEDGAGQTFAVFHPALALTRPVGLPDEKAAPLARGEALIRQAIAP